MELEQNGVDVYSFVNCGLNYRLL